MDWFERARGRWREILGAAGISAAFLVNRHGPCPVCGGRDRFRFDDQHGEGSFFCNQCRAGNGLVLLRKFRKCGHAEAIEFIEAYLGKNASAAPYSPKPVPSRDASFAAKLIAESIEPAVVKNYLTRRGLSVSSSVLLGHPRCAYFLQEEDGNGNTRSRVLGHFPAVIAPICDAKGEMIGVQRVYNANVDERKKVVGALKGGTVRLFPATEELAVCEGFETGLAIHQIFGFPVWAALSAGNLEAFELPTGIMRLHVFGDNDENSVGQAAAYRLAVRINQENQRKKTGAELVRVAIPPEPGTDWLDVLNNRTLEGGL